jgi:hypothetical protein
MDGETLNIGNICNGAVPEVFERELGEVLKNIGDANTDPEQKRKILIEFTFLPFKDRSGAQIEFKCSSKTAAVQTVKGTVFFEGKGPNMVAVPHDPKQARLFQMPKESKPQ